MAEYTTLALVKEQLSIGADDTSADAQIQAVVKAASRQIDQRTARVFGRGDAAVPRVLQARGRVVRDCDGDRLLVDDIADVTGLVVEQGQTVAAMSVVSGVETTPYTSPDDGQPVTALVLPSGVWSERLVRVTAVWGWPAVPDDIAQACLIQAARLFRRKASPEGVAGSADWGVIRVSRVDPDVEALIGPYVLPGFA